jgi:hypothetical protein
MARRINPVRSVVIPTPEWEALLRLSEMTGRSASDLIREQVVALLEANDLLPRRRSIVVNPAVSRLPIPKKGKNE